MGEWNPRNTANYIKIPAISDKDKQNIEDFNIEDFTEKIIKFISNNWTNCNTVINEFKRDNCKFLKNNMLDILGSLFTNKCSETFIVNYKNFVDKFLPKSKVAFGKTTRGGFPFAQKGKGLFTAMQVALLPATLTVGFVVFCIWLVSCTVIVPAVACFFGSLAEYFYNKYINDKYYYEYINLATYICSNSISLLDNTTCIFRAFGYEDFKKCLDKAESTVDLFDNEKGKFIMLVPLEGGTKKINILGRYRKITLKGRFKLITYKGKKITITEARKLEKNIKQRSN